MTDNKKLIEEARNPNLPYERRCDIRQELADALEAAEKMLNTLAAGFRRTEAPEPRTRVACPHWAEGKITMRKGCTACDAEGRPPEPQAEPSDAQVRSVWDALGPRVTVHLDFEDLRAALRAAAKTGGER
ncbi:hypothetical protein [Microbacterium aurugineum]|uniref:hypothetical protein n=1 Tax=Microbacterium aurugineum TaxID=2851642 RepID=UPI0020C11153|nr:hypothetical protein [Microbacterium aurugineum]MCK8477213.1 hypothetical protein [Microbacterium aurugineum]